MAICQSDYEERILRKIWIDIQILCLKILLATSDHAGSGLSVLTRWSLGDLDTIFNLDFLIGIFKYPNDNAPRWTPRDPADDKSALVWVMAWCRQKTSFCQIQCWISSTSPNGVIRSQWVNSSKPGDAHIHQKTRPSLEQIMACRKIDNKPYSQPKWTYCHLTSLSFGTNFSEIQLKNDNLFRTTMFL